VFYPADYALRGVPVPAGECTLEFLYRPRSFWIGMAVAAASLLLLLGLARWSR